MATIYTSSQCQHSESKIITHQSVIKKHIDMLLVAGGKSITLVVMVNVSSENCTTYPQGV